ncbi:sulfatase-like hydrolase/transferase [Nostocaceae cyanobacterium CENA369]|uniref:Sulfatase-like hydrolase/transferase n=1 Tax=Dendronalium phyllosphericum CENA369 TaxID=1725256 RepID=A0A8J7IH96_9NOST|nr:sulfatase-like hydrolase/transferase [Dendronalium phyllosphericum]MBH8577431.1 sulfatase-like hydrolase/transferase [Dendronalium phyllosphericum CENA369]
MKTSSLRTRFFALMMIGVLVVNVLLSAPQKAFAQTSKPNIVFVLVDDMDADTINEDPENYAPHIKRLLIDKGITFPNFFVDVSLCCPSRTSILRGQYAHNTGVLNNSRHEGGFQQAHKNKLEQETIATSLKANGYRTALIGKYLNGYPDTVREDEDKIPDTYVPPGWTEWYSPMEKGKKKNKAKGYGNPYTQYGYTLNQNGRLVKYGNNSEDYGTDVYTSFARNFIKNSARDNKPFFLYFAPFNIHSPYTPADRYKHLFNGVKAPRPDNFNETDREGGFNTKPKFMQKKLKNRLDREQIDFVDKSYRKRLRSLQSVDDAVNKLIDTLKESGQLDNTYIVFTSDNGYKQGIHRISLGKESAYEEDIRLNLFVRGPGVPVGKKLPQIVGNIDFFPTFADIAGVQPPSFVDGRSFLPLLKGTTEPRKWRSAFLVEHTLSKKNALEDKDDLDNDLLQLEEEEQSQLADEDDLDNDQSQLEDEDDLDNDVVQLEEEEDLGNDQLQLTDEERSQLADEVQSQLTDEEQSQLADEVRSQLAGEVRSQLADEVRSQLADEMRSELIDEARSELIDEARSQLTDEVRSQLQLRRKKKQQVKFPTYDALRTRNYTYIEYRTGAKELYNIKKDPYQLHNLANTANQALLQRLTNRLNKLRTCQADSCREIEEEQIEEEQQESFTL